MTVKTNWKAHLYIVFDTGDEEKASEVCRLIQSKAEESGAELSFSPMRLSSGNDDSLEVHATGLFDPMQKKLLLDQLDNDWDVDQDGSLEIYSAYGFNTKMISPLIYYLRAEFS